MAQAPPPLAASPGAEPTPIRPLSVSTGYIAEPGGSIRSSEVEDACREHQIALGRTRLRLVHH